MKKFIEKAAFTLACLSVVALVAYLIINMSTYKQVEDREDAPARTLAELNDPARDAAEFK